MDRCGDSNPYTMQDQLMGSECLNANHTWIPPCHPPACGWWTLDDLHGAAAVQGITKTEALAVFQQAIVGGNLSPQLDLDVQQSLLVLGLVLPLCPDLCQL
ncbi:hypothetical protein TREES_T100012062 [Tupaia chinensis]|uniref:Uncharacterized protein n=1 Tax=Tupaia chinensis TaxID=246437 RepID=L9K9U5_TUPCH|nr:hypothetical protein TREES_T100012062 [Tupaia chinensis]